jgi:hypothetical protein
VNKKILIALGGLAVLVGIIFWMRGGPEFPKLPVVDVAPDGTAAQVEKISGKAYLRKAPVSILKEAQSAPQFDNQGHPTPLGWGSVSTKEKLQLESLFYLAQGAFVQVRTPGNWIVMMDGEGEFYFDEAKKNAENTAHSTLWWVKKGMIRAKSYEKAPGKFYLEVRAGDARVLVENGEIGLRFSEKVGGQVWLVQGRATVKGPGFKRRELKPGVVETL